MITKIFLFQFVNSYASFFYLAFIADSLGDCPPDGCMGTLGRCFEYFKIVKIRVSETYIFVAVCSDHAFCKFAGHQR